MKRIDHFIACGLHNLKQFLLGIAKRFRAYRETNFDRNNLVVILANCRDAGQCLLRALGWHGSVYTHIANRRSRRDEQDEGNYILFRAACEAGIVSLGEALWYCSANFDQRNAIASALAARLQHLQQRRADIARLELERAQHARLQGIVARQNKLADGGRL